MRTEGAVWKSYSQRLMKMTRREKDGEAHAVFSGDEYMQLKTCLVYKREEGHEYQKKSAN